jgi:hypothetical protein
MRAITPTTTSLRIKCRTLDDEDLRAMPNFARRYSRLPTLLRVVDRHSPRCTTSQLLSPDHLADYAVS